ncbi:MAG: LuxR family transcriptional regulator [Anaerolineae bacterium]|nr:LuxR family transcriptional regulator [Anaerolineae bacterium]
MAASILTTKLYIPPPRPGLVLRPHLVKQLNDNLPRKMTLISAPAGFGKTTLVSEWVADRTAAWLSLHERDNDPTQFLTYFIAALQTIAPTAGQWVLAALQTPQPPPTEIILTTLLNEIAAIPDHFVLVLDDYHVIESETIDQFLDFLLDHLPPSMHLVIVTREDPALPLARLRAAGQLTELRAAHLRFTQAEAAAFLNQVMGLHLAAAEVAALENRTEGWIAGLQLAALALRGEAETSQFIQSFTGSHRFVLDYLVEEVWAQQPANVQTFLLATAILERLCAPLADALVQDSTIDGAEMLAYLERANLFIIPLDNERRWYRYHHLFADLLRQRLQAQAPTAIQSLHQRAAAWYEQEGWEMEAFSHAAAAQDIPAAARLLAGKGMPLLFRGAARPVLAWLASLPASVLDAHPYLWVTYANAILFQSQIVGVEEKLQAAEAAMTGAALDEAARDLIGYIATTRATIAVVQQDVGQLIAQSRRALDYLHPANLPMRTATTWTLAFAYQLRGDRVAAEYAYREALGISEKIGHFIITLMASLGLGHIQEMQLDTEAAAATYQRVLALAGEPPLPVACAAFGGLARLAYERNNLAEAEQYGETAAQLARQIEKTDRLVTFLLFLAQLKLAQGNEVAATAYITQAEQFAQQHQFSQQMPAIAAASIQLLLYQGNVAGAAQRLHRYDLPLSAARVALAQGENAAALTLLQGWQQIVEAKGWRDEQLRGLLLLAVAYQAVEEMETALDQLTTALTLAEPIGYVRPFFDEGPPMSRLLAAAAQRGIRPTFTTRLLTLWTDHPASEQLLVEPLSQRELEILRLIAQGFSNQEIGERLYLALDTVKGHNRRIFAKLQVQRRTEAVARGRALGLI